jgi:hypothetical protein
MEKETDFCKEGTTFQALHSIQKINQPDASISQIYSSGWLICLNI